MGDAKHDSRWAGRPDWSTLCFGLSTVSWRPAALIPLSGHPEPARRLTSPETWPQDGPSP
jgi:hypothetical protein